MHKKLFIPGPVEVYPDVLKALSTPMIGHRTKEYAELHRNVKLKLQQLLYTKNRIFLSTSSGTGLMEACVRNCVAKRAVNFICGEFGERWYEIVTANGKEADPVRADLGKAIKPDMVKKALKTGKYDAVFVTHNETSTGVMNSLEEIAAVVNRYPDIIFMVDAVSAMAGIKIEVDKLKIDVCLASTQKGFGLPPGFAMCSVSEKALKKAEGISNRGYYFDFLVFKKFDEKNQTPTTPSLPHLYALNHQLDKFFEEGLENRFRRHKQMAEYCRNWVKKNGFGLFPEPGYESITMTTGDNTRKIDIRKLNDELGKKGFMISAGYGRLKESTFRIAHMGDVTLDELKELLTTIEVILKTL